MASYEIATDETAEWGKVVGAATVDTITITRNREEIRVTKEDSGTDELWVTFDGSTPAANGPKSHRIRGVQYAAIVHRPRGGSGTDVVKVISAGTPTYSVEASI